MSMKLHFGLYFIDPDERGDISTFDESGQRERTVAHNVHQDDAKLIVRAVNSYDLMLASLKELLARDPGLWTPAIERARAAIRIAEGEGTP